MSTIRIEGINGRFAFGSSSFLLQILFAVHSLVSPAGAEKLLMHNKAIINKSFIKRLV